MKLSLLFLVALFAALATLVPSVATAQTTLLATDDAYVRGGALSDNNFNLSWTNPGDALRVRTAIADTNKRKSYIRFDLSNYVGVVGSATLSIWLDRAVNSLSGTPTDTADFFGVADGDWTESAITWNNAPSQGDYLFTQVFRRRVTADPDTMYTWDVTAYVKSKFTGVKKVSFLLADTNYTTHHTDLRIYSRETVGFEPFLTISPTTDVTPNSGPVPDRFELQQNYPNPFNPTTTIGFSIPSLSSPYSKAGSLTTLRVYDLLGREMQTLVNETLSPGAYSVSLDASGLGSGTYFYTLTSGNLKESKRMVVLK
jgi:hypothetical protein